MMKLANYVQAGFYGKGGVFGVGSRQLVFDDLPQWELLIKVAATWTQPFTETQIKEVIVSKYPDIHDSKIDHAIQLLKSNHFLMESNEFEKNDRYSRNKLYFNLSGGRPKVIQQKLRRSAVTILGCGGIGNHVSFILATSGVGRINLVDDDIIEKSNLTRQVLFTEADISKRKVDVLSEALQVRNSEVVVETYPLKIQSEDELSLLPSSNLLVVSADHPSLLMHWVNRYCVKNLIPYINVGYINDISVFGPFYIPNQTGCFECQAIVPFDHANSDLNRELEIINNNFQPASFSSVNSVSAAMAACDIIKFLGQFGSILSANKRVGIHSSSLKIETQSLERAEACKVCGHL
jgi:hypothetical protein